MKTGPKAEKPAASRVTKIEGKKLHYLIAGQGPALILLHGYTQTSRMWRPLIDKLKDKFTVIAPDLPGIGDSDIPKNSCDMKTAAIRIHALAKSIGVTKARVVGHDIGLMVAYAYAEQFSTESTSSRRVAGFHKYFHFNRVRRRRRSGAVLAAPAYQWVLR
jgi:pimeloyl-ACP methyl ester carboxylesterase